MPWQIYLNERICLRDKSSRFSRIFAKYAKLNPRKKSTGSQFAKLNPRKNKKKKNFFRFLELAKLTFLSMNDGHVKNILQDIKQYK